MPLTIHSGKGRTLPPRSISTGSSYFSLLMGKRVVFCSAIRLQKKSGQRLETASVRLEKVTCKLEVDATRKLEVAVAARRSHLTNCSRPRGPSGIDSTERHFIGNVGAIYLEDELHPLRRNVEATT